MAGVGRRLPSETALFFLLVFSTALVWSIRCEAATFAPITGKAIGGRTSQEGAARGFTVLWSFGEGGGGDHPIAPLIAGAGGTLLGTTTSGGALDDGTVFELSPSGNAYTERVLWNFGRGEDGEYPYGRLLSGGNTLYGVTQYGGLYELGTAFKLTPDGSHYTERVLWNFGDGTDGAAPYAGLIAGTNGLLYGTTLYGGPSNTGIAFELTRQPKYAERILSNVGSNASLLSIGNAFFGTTPDGGSMGFGTAFKLTPSGSGYKRTDIWVFGKAQDGSRPYGGLVMDENGALYGTTRGGGANNYGTVFKLTPAQSGYTERVLWSFGNLGDAHNPVSDIAMIGSALYGTSPYGGRYGFGAVFVVKPSGTGYTERLLWSFHNANDGASPYTGLLVHNGGLYGTVPNGGANGGGTAFKVVP